MHNERKNIKVKSKRKKWNAFRALFSGTYAVAFSAACFMYSTRILSPIISVERHSFVPCPTFQLKWRTYYYTTALHRVFLSCNSQIRKRLKIHICLSLCIKYGYSVVAGWSEGRFHSWHVSCASYTSDVVLCWPCFIGAFALDATKHICSHEMDKYIFASLSTFSLHCIIS